MSITVKEKQPLLLSIKLYEQYRLNKIKKYRRKHIEDLRNIINTCETTVEELEQEIRCYANIHIKSGFIIFGYCLFSFGNSVLKDSLMSVMTVERLKRENKTLEKKIENLNEENKGLELKVSMLNEECKTLRSEGGELQLCINNLRKEKSRLYSKILELLERLKGYENLDEEVNEKKTKSISYFK